MTDPIHLSRIVLHNHGRQVSPLGSCGTPHAGMRREVHTPKPVGAKRALRIVWPGQEPSPQRQHGPPQSSLSMPGYSYPDGHRIALYECLSTETSAEPCGTSKNRNYRQHSKLHKVMTLLTTPITRHERAPYAQIGHGR